MSDETKSDEPVLAERKVLVFGSPAEGIELLDERHKVELPVSELRRNLADFIVCHRLDLVPAPVRS